MLSNSKSLLAAEFAYKMMHRPDEAANINTLFTEGETQSLLHVVQMCQRQNLLSSFRFVYGAHVNKKDHVSIILGTGQDLKTAIFYVIKKSGPTAFSEYTALMRTPDFETNIRVDTVNFDKVADQLHTHFAAFMHRQTHLSLIHNI